MILWQKLLFCRFLFFAVVLGLKNVLVIMKKETLAVKISKVYVVAFLIYWFVFLIYWDCISFIDGKYMQIIFSIPLWLGGFYFTYKSFLRKRRIEFIKQTPICRAELTSIFSIMVTLFQLSLVTLWLEKQLCKSCFFIKSIRHISYRSYTQKKYWHIQFVII